VLAHNARFVRTVGSLWRTGSELVIVRRQVGRCRRTRAVVRYEFARHFTLDTADITATETVAEFVNLKSYH